MIPNSRLMIAAPSTCASETVDGENKFRQLHTDDISDVVIDSNHNNNETLYVDPTIVSVSANESFTENRSLRPVINVGETLETQMQRVSELESNLALLRRELFDKMENIQQQLPKITETATSSAISKNNTKSNEMAKTSTDNENTVGNHETVDNLQHNEEDTRKDETEEEVASEDSDYVEPSTRKRQKHLFETRTTTSVPTLRSAKHINPHDLKDALNTSQSGNNNINKTTTTTTTTTRRELTTIIVQEEVVNPKQQTATASLSTLKPVVSASSRKRPLITRRKDKLSTTTVSPIEVAARVQVQLYIDEILSVNGFPDEVMIRYTETVDRVKELLSLEGVELSSRDKTLQWLKDNFPGIEKVLEYPFAKKGFVVAPDGTLKRKTSKNKQSFIKIPISLRSPLFTV